MKNYINAFILIAVSLFVYCPDAISGAENKMGGPWTQEAYFENMGASTAVEAMKYFDRAHELRIKDEKIWFKIGCLLESFDKNNEARFCYDRLIEEDIDDIRAMFIRAYNLNRKFKEHKWSDFSDAAKPYLARAIKRELLNIKDTERKMRVRNRISTKTSNETYYQKHENCSPGNRKLIYKYDTDENLISVEVFDPVEKFVSRTKYRYDADCFPVEETLSDPDDRVISLMKYQRGCDEFQLPQYEVCVDGQGKTPWKSEYIFKIHDQMVEFFEKRRDTAKNLLGEYQCMYDNLGYPIYIAVTDDQGVASISYDKKYHRVDKVIFYKHDGIMVRHGHFYEYDDFGNVVKKAVKTPEIDVGAPFKHEIVHNIGEYKYRYDPYGNLIEEVYFDKKSNAVYKKEFTYEYHLK